MNIEDIRELRDNILGEYKDEIVEVPLKDLVWTVIVYSLQMSEIEDDVFLKDKGEVELHNSLIIDREEKACRRDEIVRIANQYSSMEGYKIYEGVEGLFKDYH